MLGTRNFRKIAIAQELSVDVFPSITAGGQVVQAIRKLDEQRSCHALKLG